MRRHILVPVLTIAVAAPIPATAVAMNDSDNKVVCRRDREMNLGSHIRAPRTCRTRAEWREIEEHTQNEMQQIRDGQEARLPEGNSIPPLLRPTPN